MNRSVLPMIFGNGCLKWIIGIPPAPAALAATDGECVILGATRSASLNLYVLPNERNKSNIVA